MAEKHSAPENIKREQWFKPQRVARVGGKKRAF